MDLLCGGAGLGDYEALEEQRAVVAEDAPHQRHPGRVVIERRVVERRRSRQQPHVVAAGPSLASLVEAEATQAVWVDAARAHCLAHRERERVASLATLCHDRRRHGRFDEAHAGEFK